MNGAGGRASEIKRPVDGLFSRAVIYDCSLEEEHPLSSRHRSSPAPPPVPLSSFPFPRMKGSGNLPQWAGQFHRDKEVDRNGRYLIGISHKQ